MKLVVLLFSLFVGAVCVGQPISNNKSWYVKAQAGYGQGIKLHTVQFVGEVTYLSGQEADRSGAEYVPYFAGSGYQLAIAVGKKLTSVLGFELGLNYQNNHKVFKLQGSEIEKFKDNLQTTTYRGFLMVASPAIMLRHSFNKNTFYVSMGFSIGGGELSKEIVNQKYNDIYYYDKMRYVSGLHFGMGIEKRIAVYWSAVADLRLNSINYHYTRNTGFINTSYPKDYNSQISFSNIALNLGVMYHF